ncbi:MAG: hypothetical protein ACPLXC_00175 [Candidatus Pacearchaeota archaeon]
MKFKIEKKEDNPLMERYELYVKIEDTGPTPSNEYVKQEVSKATNKSSDLIVMKKVLQAYGKKEANAWVYVYESPEALKKFEHAKKEKKAVAGAPAKTGGEKVN